MYSKEIKLMQLENKVNRLKNKSETNSNIIKKAVRQIRRLSK